MAFLSGALFNEEHETLEWIILLKHIRHIEIFKWLLNIGDGNIG